MTTFIEPLPGLLDDPLLHLSDLPPRTDVRIPPLRDPFPSRALSALSPLEPNAPGEKQTQGGVKLGSCKNAPKPQRTHPTITPTDLISARDTNNPNSAVGARLESNSTNQLPKLLPPSFVNLAAVENNPSFQSWLPAYRSSKRVKLDQEYHGDHLQLPKPHPKQAFKPVPLLPTIVNGIHEPPPSAALLPPMELEEVKAMLASISEPLSLPPEKMLNPAEPDYPDLINQAKLKPTFAVEDICKAINIPSSANGKPPRTWKKWSDGETQQLLKGVAKHGAGKWKEICADSELKFRDRRPTDLKDRFRICFPSASKEKSGNPRSTNTHKKPTPAEGRSRDDNVANEPPSSINAIFTTSFDVPPDNYTSSNLCRESSVFTKLKDSTADLAIVAKSRANQRVRKLWTEEEHQNLVKGFAKHGYQWTTIRNDSALNLSHRKATDIRDKFRSLFPQQYMDADSGPPVGKKPFVAADPLKSSCSPQTSANHQMSDKRKPSTSAAVIPVKAPPPPPPPTTTTTTRTEECVKEGSGVETLEIAPETSSAPNLTLPPLTLGDNDWDWGDNKLAPLLDWEEFGL